MGHGGARPGAGKPKGYKHKQTLEKLEAREYVRRKVALEIQSITDALIDSARGLPVLLARGIDLKWHRVTDPERIEKALNAGTPETVKVYVQDPDIKALQQALDRLLGPVTQNIELTGKDGEALIIKWQS